MRFPSFNDYQAALQNPAICFENFDLRACHVDSDLWGLPRVRSGGFALTYKLFGKNDRTFAVRCFHRFVPDRSTRYVAISRFLSQTHSDVLLPVRYIPRGIQIRGAWYPITLMNWIEGDTLETFLIKNYTDKEKVESVAKEFLRVVGELERLGISHGDISHRNVIVRDHRLILIDYDGMYVPDLTGRKSCEVGNVNFQHPGRSAELFSVDIDRFSEIVIFLALKAIATNPELWDRYQTGGEGLLFKRDDFLRPLESPLLHEMETYSQLKPWVSRFRKACLDNVRNTPRLQDFIHNRSSAFTDHETPLRRPLKATQSATIRAGDRLLLLTHLGKVSTVVGKVTEVFQGVSKDGHIHFFLNTGNWREKCFTIVLWADALALLYSMKKKPENFLDCWVSVTGLITIYNRRPQIVIESPSDIEILSGDVEAQQRLAPSQRKPFLLKGFANNPVIREKNPVRISDYSGRMDPLDLTSKAREELDQLYGPIWWKRKNTPGDDQGNES